MAHFDPVCAAQVDGVSITYQTTDGSSSETSHGTVFELPTKTISLEGQGLWSTYLNRLRQFVDRTSIANEIVSAVFGRAGHQSFYKREMINSIGFVIFDTMKGTTRVEGVSRADHAFVIFFLFTRLRQPFGDDDKTSEGMPFYSSDVVAFGSISKPNPIAHCEFLHGGRMQTTANKIFPTTVSLCGLFFFKKLSD